MAEEENGVMEEFTLDGAAPVAFDMDGSASGKAAFALVSGRVFCAIYAVFPGPVALLEVAQLMMGEGDEAARACYFTLQFWQKEGFLHSSRIIREHPQDYLGTAFTTMHLTMRGLALLQKENPLEKAGGLLGERLCRALQEEDTVGIRTLVDHMVQQAVLMPRD